MSNKVVVDGIVFDKPTELQERFFDCFLEQNFENATRAAEKAGVQAADNDSLRVRAYQLANIPWVKYMIEKTKQEARDKIIQSTMLTREEVIGKMRKIFDEAMIDGKYDPAFKAAHALGTEIDMFTTKSERTDRRITVDMNNPESQQKIAQLAALLSGDFRSDTKVLEDSKYVVVPDEE